MLAGEVHALDIRDTSELAAIITRSGVEAVVHFAAFIEAGVSVREPWRFFDNVEFSLILNGVLLTATDVNYVIILLGLGLGLGAGELSEAAFAR